MDLTQKFKVVASITIIALPRFAEVNKPYSIMRVIKKLGIAGFIIFLVLGFNNNEAMCVLDPCYSLAFKDNYISEINSDSGRYKLIFRKNLAITIVTFWKL
jgi:hypothetical protein